MSPSSENTFRFFSTMGNRRLASRERRTLSTKRLYRCICKYFKDVFRVPFTSSRTLVIPLVSLCEDCVVVEDEELSLLFVFRTELFMRIKRRDFSKRKYALEASDAVLPGRPSWASPFASGR